MKEEDNNIGKKTILFVEANEDGTVGGSYFSLQLLVKCLDKTKYSPIVLLYDDIPFACELFKGICRLVILKKPHAKKLKCSYKFIQPFDMFYRKAKSLLRREIFPFVKIFSILIVNRVDLIHLNNSVNAGRGWLLAARILRKPCVAHQRGFAEVDGRTKKYIKNFDKIICISRSVCESFELNRMGNTQVIYNPIDIENYISRIKKSKIAVRQEFQVDGSAPLIGMVGNFQEWKGQTVLVKAVDLLRKQYPGMVCLLIGAVSTKSKEDMEYFKRVKELIVQNNLQKHIIITGFREDVPDLINALDVQLHCSISPEPFGRVLIEGMALRKPIIATDIGGPREIIENGISGLLISPNSPDALKGKIEYLLKNRDIRETLGENALERVKEKFTIEKFTYEIHRIYEELLG